MRVFTWAKGTMSDVKMAWTFPRGCTDTSGSCMQTVMEIWLPRRSFSKHPWHWLDRKVLSILIPLPLPHRSGSVLSLRTDNGHRNSNGQRWKREVVWQFCIWVWPSLIHHTCSSLFILQKTDFSSLPTSNIPPPTRNSPRHTTLPMPSSASAALQQHKVHTPQHCRRLSQPHRLPTKPTHWCRTEILTDFSIKYHIFIPNFQALPIKT